MYTSSVRQALIVNIVFSIQMDSDNDGVGDVCVGDADSDSVYDYQVFTVQYGSDMNHLKLP